MPTNKYKSLPYKGIIKINESLPTWGFTLRSIKYNDIEYQMNIPCIIHSAMENMFVSDYFFRFLSTTFFNDTNKYRLSSTSVFKDFKEPIPEKIDFLFEDMKLKLKLNDLFNASESQFVRENTQFHNFTGLFLGSKFLYLFNYSLFDYEQKQLEFYSDTILISNKKNNLLNKMIFPLICIIVFICLVEILVLFYYKLLNKNK